MRLFIIILLIFFIPIPIIFNIYYSNINYYIKLYKLTLISKSKLENKAKKSEPKDKKKHAFFSDFNEDINLKTFLLDLHNTNLKFKPLLRIKLDFSYSFNDAAKTAISYGVLCQSPILIYKLLGFLFSINKFDYKINPIFEDKFLVKIEISSIIFISLANIIYITIILVRCIIKQRR